jgi:2-hydroxy-3-keto-5-methylthiopentenyl-1-phosphate phosphatase
MVDTVGMGYTERRKINEEIINERVSYQDGFRTMLESVHRPFKEMEELVRRGEDQEARGAGSIALSPRKRRV